MHYQPLRYRLTAFKFCTSNLVCAVAGVRFLASISKVMYSITAHHNAIEQLS